MGLASGRSSPCPGPWPVRNGDAMWRLRGQGKPTPQERPPLWGMRPETLGAPRPSRTPGESSRTCSLPVSISQKAQLPTALGSGRSPGLAGPASKDSLPQSSCPSGCRGLCSVVPSAKITRAKMLFPWGQDSPIRISLYAFTAKVRAGRGEGTDGVTPVGPCAATWAPSAPRLTKSGGRCCRSGAARGPRAAGPGCRSGCVSPGVESVCLVDLIKQQVQKSGHMAVMGRVRVTSRQWLQ